LLSREQQVLFPYYSPSFFIALLFVSPSRQTRFGFVGLGLWPACWR